MFSVSEKAFTRIALPVLHGMRIRLLRVSSDVCCAQLSSAGRFELCDARQ